MEPHHRTWPVACLLFASGFCALVYQIGWLREFRLIFGASTAASAAVLAIFIGGLGFGGWLLGRRADSHTRPLGLYAQLEGVVALSAAASPILLALVRQLYVVAGGTPRLGLVGGTVVRLVLSALVLAIPTIAMGGTLPAAARAITGSGDQRRRQLALLYGCNTLGASPAASLPRFLRWSCSARVRRCGWPRRSTSSSRSRRERSIARCLRVRLKADITRTLSTRLRPSASSSPPPASSGSRSS